MFNQASKLYIVLLLQSALNCASFHVDVPPTCLVRSPRSKNTSMSQATTEEMSKTTDAPSTLPPLFQEVGNQRREFEMNLGKAMDVLRNDYPDMLVSSPDFSIYHDDISVTDPSGVEIKGISSYKSSFRFLQTVVRLFYNTDRSKVQMRSFYDFARNSIRISFNVELVPRVIGDRRNSLYVDGISVYKLDLKSGKIIEHSIENFLINNTPVTPPHGIFSTLRRELLQPSERLVPAGACYSEGSNVC